MLENENFNIKLPFHFVDFCRRKHLLKNFKLLTPSKNQNFLYKDNNTQKKAESKEKSYIYIKKQNINQSTQIMKYSTSNYFPPLLKRKNDSSIFKKIESEKKLNGIDNYMGKRLKLNEKNENYQLLKLTKKINLNDIIKYNINSKIKIRNNHQKNSLMTPKHIDSKTIYSTMKNNTIQPIRQKNNIEINKSVNVNPKNFSLVKTTIGKENKTNLKISKSCDRNTLMNELNNKTNGFQRIYRYNNNIFDKKKMMLKYCIYPGNNTDLIELVMTHRKEVWEKTNTKHYKYCDMVWAPLTYDIDFKTSQIMHTYVNHIPFNEEISNKMRLYGNLLYHCEKKNIDAYKILPFTIIFTLSHHSYSEQIENFKNLFKDIDNYTPKSNVKFSFLFNALLNKKIGSKQNINIPKTFNSGKNMWIIKPVNLNRGRCIKVLNNLNAILNELKLIQTRRKINIVNNNFEKVNTDDNYQTINTHYISNSPERENNNSYGIKCEYIIIQKYLEKPLLYQGRKFDIRIWVLFITNRENEIFIFKEGHLKAASIKYNLNSDDLFIHLTNYSVQKYHSKFSDIEIGNEIPFSDFQSELDKNHSKINFRKDIYPQIVRIVRLTGGMAKKGKMNFMGYEHCFEIFGYDFILDENYNPYLLEINTNPGLEFSSPLIKKLLPRMIDDAFKLTIDEEFKMSNVFMHQDSEFPVDNYKNSENLWDRYTVL